MAKKLLTVYEMIGESRDGQKYQVELVCEPGNEAETFKKHIEKIGWDCYGYKLIEFKKPITQHVEVFFEEE
jgi:hypothetical protein